MATFVSVNPATGEVLQQIPIMDEAEVGAAVVRATAAQSAWQARGVRERCAVLRAFGRILHESRQEVAECITREAGKPVVEALLTEVLVVLDAVRFCSENAHEFLQAQVVPHGNPIMKVKRGRLLREPYGVVGIIAPWNYPFSIPATETLAALVTGNAVVLKPSEFTTLVGLKLAELLHEVGVPKDVMQVVTGEGVTGAALLNAPIHKLIFTGSVGTGRRIAEAAGRKLLPVVLELGGKDPMLVLEDAPVDVASSAAVWGAFVNCGQACLSVERCYVHRAIYDAFVAACVEKTKRLRVGDGKDPNVEVGPMIHARQMAHVASQVNDARAADATVLTGGRALPELGANFYAPTVITGVNHSMRIMREETFGPVLCVMPFESPDSSDPDAEAIALANDSEFGLAASVWTGNRARGEVLARRIHAGTVMVNDAIACFGISEAPHGGVGQSGIGRTHGWQGLDEMVQLKYVDSDYTGGIPKVWWYGYSPAFARQMDGFMEFLFSGSLVKRLAGGLRSVGAFVRKGRV